MSRGLGRLQERVLACIPTAPDTISHVQLRCLVLGCVPAREAYTLPDRPGRWRPSSGQDRTLRRAVAGLIRRGLVVREEYRPLGWKRIEVRYHRAVGDR